MSDLSVGRQLHSCGMINDNYIVVAGGRNARGTLKSVEIFNKATHNWFKGPPLPVAISYAAMVQHPSGGVVLIGGQSGLEILDTLYHLPNM